MAPLNPFPWVDLIIAAVSLLVAWSGFLIGIIKWFLANYHKGLSEKFQGVSDQITANNNDSARRNEAMKEELRRIDREMMEMRAMLPDKYVRREDAIREQVVISAKLDSLAAKIDNVILRGGINAG